LKILGIDTSTEICSIGLIEDKTIIIEYTINSLQKKHSLFLVPTIKDILEKVNLKLNDINGIAISLGPGSFTGLRIGLGVAKGLAYANSLPLIGIPTLKALAFPFKEIPHLICTILDAKKSEIYSAVFQGGNNLEKISDFRCENINSLVKRLCNLKGKVIFTGEGALRYREIITEAMGQDALFIQSSLNLLLGSNIAFLGLERFERGERDNIFSISPIYLRKSEAEIIWENK